MQKRWSRILALAMGIPLLLGILAACGAGTGTTTSSGPITIEVASDLPTSGNDTSSGQPTQDGAELAVKQANSGNFLPGYKFVFVPKDDVGPSGSADPDTGAQNIRALIGDSLVAGVVGPFNSGVAKNEMPLANQASLTLISPSNTNQCLTQRNAAIGCTGSNDLVPSLRPTGNVTYFRIATTDDHQGPANADYLYNSQHFKSAYVVDDTTVYGAGIAATFTQEWKKLGGTITGNSSEPQSTTSFVSILTQVAATHPDVIYYGGTDANGGLKLRQEMQQVPGLTNTAFGGGDGIVTPTFATTIGTTGGPVFGTVASADVTKNPAAASFLKDYNATYKTLGAYSAAGYDCMQILLNAVKAAVNGGAKAPTDSGDSTNAKTFRQAVVAQMKKTDYTGLTGHHTFDANGDTTNKIITIQQLAEIAGKPGWNVIKTITVA